MALREAGWPITGWGPRRETLDLAIELGAIDQAAATPEEAIREAELVIAAGPIRTIPDLFRSVAAAASPGTAVTDVASVKGQVMTWARELLPERVDFVGGHPMAGRELQGVGAASAGLLRGCTYCLVPTNERSRAVGLLLATTLGAKALIVDAQAHDSAVAATSHLPFVVATALVQTVAADLEGLAGNVAASGFRDVTRVAAGSPQMHADIGHFNQPALADWIDRFQQALDELKAQLTQPTLEDAFSVARDQRLAWAERKQMAAKP